VPMDYCVSPTKGMRALYKMTTLFKKPLLLLCSLTIVMGMLTILISKPPAGLETAKAKQTALSKVVQDKQGNPIISADSTKARLLAQEQEYQILYQEAYDSFLISINTAPFEEARKKAEQSFLSLIESSESVACKLKVEIVTPNFANPEFSGQKFPLSFCQK